MRICIYGAGAIGGHLAVRFANAGEQVSLVARGQQLTGLRERGLTLESEAENVCHHLPATDNPAELGEQDVVVVAVKANGLDAMAPGLRPLLGPHTRVVFAINGIPWWYLDELRGNEATSSPIREVVERRRVIACVVYSANTVTQPGVIHNEMPSANRFSLGALTPEATETCAALAQSLTAGGAQGHVSDDIRTEIWRKVQINTMFGAVACLTGANGRTIAGAEDLRPICLNITAETAAVAAAWGIHIHYDPAKLRAENYSNHKSSILQDLELGRPMEIDEISGAVTSPPPRSTNASPCSVCARASLAFIQNDGRWADCSPPLSLKSLAWRAYLTRQTRYAQRYPSSQLNGMFTSKRLVEIVVTSPLTSKTPQSAPPPPQSGPLSPPHVPRPHAKYSPPCPHPPTTAASHRKSAPNVQPPNPRAPS
jgi:2-dehydropantoate 2-reductase